VSLSRHGNGRWHGADTHARPIRTYTFQQNIGVRRFNVLYGILAIEFTDGEGNEEKCPDVLDERRRHRGPTSRTSPESSALPGWYLL